MWNFFTNPTFLKIAEIFLLVILGFVLYQLINYRKIRKREIEKSKETSDWWHDIAVSIDCNGVSGICSIVVG